jgi:hypothetical protein
MFTKIDKGNTGMGKYKTLLLVVPIYKLLEISKTVKNTDITLGM